MVGNIILVGFVITTLIAGLIMWIHNIVAEYDIGIVHDRVINVLLNKVS